MKNEIIITRESAENTCKEIVDLTITKNKAAKLVNKLVGKIEGMELDCDAEVYESLLKIQSVLAR